MWNSLSPDPAMVAALDAADRVYSRAAIRLEMERLSQTGDSRHHLRDMRKRWSEMFADACAVMLADGMRSKAALRRFKLSPNADGSGRESFQPLGKNKGKRIDVVASSALLGLQIGVSLKGLNFADDEHGNFDKNLSGRLYEVREEISVVHEHLPRAFMGVVFFMPVASCFDKARAPSSFAHTVAELRARSGRIDASIVSQNWRSDFAAVCLYSSGEIDDLRPPLARGIFRFFPLIYTDGLPNFPPRRGLPAYGQTMDLPELVDHMIASALSGSAVDALTSEPEPGFEMSATAAPNVDVIAPVSEEPAEDE